MGETLTGAVTTMVGIVTDSVVPMATTAPFVYFLAIALIAGAVSLFGAFRGTLH